MSGVTLAESLLISPGELVPISMTAYFCMFVSEAKVRGTPIWLFLLPLVL